MPLWPEIAEELVWALESTQPAQPPCLTGYLLMGLSFSPNLSFLKGEVHKHLRLERCLHMVLHSVMTPQVTGSRAFSKGKSAVTWKSTHEADLKWGMLCLCVCDYERVIVHLSVKRAPVHWNVCKNTRRVYMHVCVCVLRVLMKEAKPAERMQEANVFWRVTKRVYLMSSVSTIKIKTNNK